MALRAFDGRNLNIQVGERPTSAITSPSPQRHLFVVPSTGRMREALLTEQAARELEDLLANPRALSPTPPRDLSPASCSFMGRRV